MMHAALQEKMLGGLFLADLAVVLIIQVYAVSLCLRKKTLKKGLQKLRVKKVIPLAKKCRKVYIAKLWNHVKKKRSTTTKTTNEPKNP